MRNGLNIWPCMILGATAWASAQMARQYSWSFPEGNVVTNWSFERDAEETCMPSTAASLLEVDCKYALGGAPSGEHVMKVVPGTAPSGNSPKSDLLKLEPNSAYHFSVWVWANWESGATSENAPLIEFFDGRKAPLGGEQPLTSYETMLHNQSGTWLQYRLPFSVPENASYMRITLLKVYSSQSVNNAFYFDNLLIQPYAGKLGYVEARSFSDANGRVEQTVFSGNDREVVNFTNYDGERRPIRQYVPLVVEKEGALSNLSLMAVGTQAVGEGLDYDFETVEEAYATVSEWVATHTQEQVGSITLNVVVEESQPMAPLGPTLLQEFTAFSDNGGQSIPFEVAGILKGSPEYDDLLNSHGSAARPVPSSSSYDLSTLDPVAYEDQYPGETNFFREVKYPVPGENPISESALPGNGFQMADGHTDKSGWALVGEPSNSPTDPEEPGPIAGPGSDGILYQWSRNRQGNYSLSYSSPEGLTFRSGSQVGTAWNITDYAYDSFNRVTSMLTPGGSLTLTEYDGQGRPISTSDVDRGEMQYLYDDKGQLRFVHPEEGGTAVSMVAHKYDASGRLIESGKTAYSWDEAPAQNSQSFPSETLERGTVFDALNAAEWFGKTGVNLTTVGLSVGQLKNTQGKMVASYYTNPDCTAPGYAGASDRRLVASFYSYDSLGRVDTVFRYLGAIETASNRLQKIAYAYDTWGRLAHKLVYANGLGNQVVNASRFEYDPEGRVARVLDKDLKPMVSYTYNGLNQLLKAQLYGKFQIEWTYSMRGEVKKIAATTLGTSPEAIFSEEMGHEDKANPDADVLAPHLPRYDGNISSILRKFSKDVTSPVELSRYNYDALGRLTQSERISAAPKVAGTSVLGNDGSIAFGNLSFGTAAVTNTEGFSYDADGSIVSRESPITGPHDYEYHDISEEPSHRLKNVSGLRANGSNLTEAGGNFQYDVRGRLVEDKGSDKVFTHGFFSDRVVKVTVPGRTFHMVYDENLNRVAELEENTGGSLIGSKVTLYEEGLAVAKEIVFRASGHPLGPVGLVKNSLWGQGGMVGVENQATGEKKLFVKDHLGSTVKVLDEATGGYAGQEEYSYWVYGILDKRVVRSGEVKPTGTFTGKEYEEALGLYYFGARWFDPELGMWTSPDPAMQFPNPYNYGGNPISYVDSDGRLIFIIAGVIIGAYIGGSVAQKWTSNKQVEWNPLDWKNEPETYIGVVAGGVVGGAAGWAAGTAFPNAAAAADKFFAGWEYVVQGCTEVGCIGVPLSKGIGGAAIGAAGSAATFGVVAAGSKIEAMGNNASKQKYKEGKECPDKPTQNFLATYEQARKEEHRKDPTGQFETALVEHTGKDGLTVSTPARGPDCTDEKDCNVRANVPGTGSYRYEHDHIGIQPNPSPSDYDWGVAKENKRGNFFLYGEYTQTHYRYKNRQLITQECSGVKF